MFSFGSTSSSQNSFSFGPSSQSSFSLGGNTSSQNAFSSFGTNQNSTTGFNTNSNTNNQNNSNQLSGSTKFSDLPDQGGPINKKTLSELEAYIQQEQAIRDEISDHFKAHSKQSETDEVDTLAQKLEILLSDIKRQTLSLTKLKEAARQELKRGESAMRLLQRAKMTTSSQYEQTGFPSMLQKNLYLPSQYDWEKTKEFQDVMERIRSSIDDLDRYLDPSFVQSDEKTDPRALKDIFSAQHNALVATASKLASLHSHVDELRDRYKGFRLRYLDDGKDPFAKKDGISFLDGLPSHSHDFEEFEPQQQQQQQQPNSQTTFSLTQGNTGSGMFGSGFGNTGSTNTGFGSFGNTGSTNTGFGSFGNTGSTNTGFGSFGNTGSTNTGFGSFGNTGSSNSSFSLGSSNTGSSLSSGFSLSGNTGTTSGSGFAFGNTNSTSNTGAGFSFGSSNTSQSQPSTSGFSFGGFGS